MCSLHLREFVRRHGELLARGITEIAVFHASRDAMLQYHADVPFALVADPGLSLYREFGVESGLRSVPHPASWWSAIRGVLAFGVTLPVTTSGAIGLPADLLIAPDGSVIAARYGQHAYDQWSVDDVLALKTSAPTPARTVQSL